MATKANRLQPSRLTAALLAAFVMPVTGAAFAQDANAQQDQTQTPAAPTKAQSLDKIVVTGSLIPQTSLETFKPVTVISAEDLKNRGFTSVQQALHESSFATGGVQGNQTSASFTQGAETNSLFGLDPGYTKYLIDGRPMANYPALYNGTSTFNNISGIPIDLVERIEILPGGQSSLYGSDAIAGVVNIILKKKLDGSVVSARVGWYDDGGGDSQRISLATSFGSDDGRFNSVFGVQFEKTDPIWAYDRDLTKQYNTHAYNGGAPLASRDWLVYSPFTSYHFDDPAISGNCDAVSSAFGGTETEQTRPGFGDTHYCGSFYTPGYRTLKNGKESTQVYTHTTFDINDNVQLYGDLLYSQESSRYHIGSNFTWWGTSVNWGYYYDPRIGTGVADAYATYFCGETPDPACVASLPGGDFLNLQRAFAPEDMGGFERSMNRDDSRSYALTLGANGTFGSSTWDYDVGFTRTEYRLTENSFARLADPINAWFQQNVLGPQLGLDPWFGAYPVFEPNYAAFYTLLTPAQFNSFTGYTHSHSRTYDNMLRAQVTNGSLFSLPGGDAGLAVAVEGGNQGWEYNPDPLLIPDPDTGNSQIWGTTSVSGSGSRSRYAVLGEMKLPLWDALTLDASARYDSYQVSGSSVSKPTYNLGIEYRPVESLLFRGQYGTAFKAPTLSDEFQGVSGFYSSAIDYTKCAALGFDPTVAGTQCPQRYSSAQYFGTQRGNPELDPITADVWSAGVVWAPTNKFSMGADYHHWNIKNEVNLQNVDQLLLDEYNCNIGNLDPNSGTCVAAYSAITRNSLGNITQIDITKVNVSNETLDAVTFETHYLQSLGSFGDLKLDGSWTGMISHDYQLYPTDAPIDLLQNPYWSTDPKYRANASLAWSKDQWTATLYANYIGPTPNYRSGLVAPGYDANGNPTGGYQTTGAGKLGSYTIYNASVNYDVTPDIQVSFLVNNLFNRYPDMDLSYPGNTGSPYNGNNYDAYGRSFYVEARWNFGKQ